MKRAVYFHGKDGSAAEAEHYRPLLPGWDVVGFDYRAQTPWDAKEEFSRFFDAQSAGQDAVMVIANSIGAFFALHALSEKSIARALLISPVVDMEALIQNMMKWAGVTEEALRQAGEIPVEGGETLSWESLCYVREHPIRWNKPASILYGERDALTSWETIDAFAARTGAELTVMPGGEHWFHTPEQMAFLDDWVKGVMKSPV